MGARYLTDLADVCRGAGLDVVEVDDWQTRARGSGGYNPGLPDHVMCHHTASPTSSDGWPDVDYCTFGDDDAPLTNLYLDRAGTVYVCAAGATNTNGSGADPCGTCPDDAMNTHAIGIEAGNNGTGEPWPHRQLDAYTTLVAALCASYGIPTGAVHSHWEWAPTRKTDPAGPDRYSDPPCPPAGPSPLSWDMDAFRADVDTGPVPIPPPSPEVPDMTDDQAAQLAYIATTIADLATRPAAAPAAVVDSIGRAWLFYRSDDGTLAGKVDTDRAFTLGGEITDAVAALAGPDGMLDVFAYTPDGTVAARHYTGQTWDGWYQVG